MWKDSLYSYYIKQIDSILPCVSSIIDHRRLQNVVTKSSVTHSAIALWATLLFLSHFGVDAHVKFGEYERTVSVVRGAAECNSSFLTVLQIPYCIHNSIDVQLKTWTDGDSNLGAETCFICDWLQNSHNARWRKTNDPFAWLNHTTISWAQHVHCFGSLLQINGNVGKLSQNTHSFIHSFIHLFFIYLLIYLPYNILQRKMEIIWGLKKKVNQL